MLFHCCQAEQVPASVERKDRKKGRGCRGFSQLTTHSAAFECRALASEECEEGTEAERGESRGERQRGGRRRHLAIYAERDAERRLSMGRTV